MAITQDIMLLGVTKDHNAITRYALVTTPPQEKLVRFGHHTYSVPMPTILWAITMWKTPGNLAQLAVKVNNMYFLTTPATENGNQILYMASLPNVYVNGGVCIPYTNIDPKSSLVAVVATSINLFWDTGFNTEVNESIAATFGTGPKHALKTWETHRIHNWIPSDLYRDVNRLRDALHLPRQKPSKLIIKKNEKPLYPTNTIAAIANLI